MSVLHDGSPRSHHLSIVLAIHGVTPSAGEEVVAVVVTVGPCTGRTYIARIPVRAKALEVLVRTGRSVRVVLLAGSGKRNHTEHHLLEEGTYLEVVLVQVVIGGLVRIGVDLGEIVCTARSTESQHTKQCIF